MNFVFRDILIADLQKKDIYTFNVRRWFTLNKESTQIYHTISPISNDDQKNFVYVFRSKSLNDFSDHHLWFSVLNRPTDSNFTGCQRLSVALTTLFCVMTASLMFYGRLPKGPAATENKGSIKLTGQKVGSIKKFFHFDFISK